MQLQWQWGKPHDAAQRRVGNRRAREDCGYLLHAEHRYGASKAKFFTGLGFALESWEVLADALRRHGQRHEVSKVKETGFGPRYEVDGELVAPQGRRARVRTVWQIDRGETAPRLITAHPLEEQP